MSVHESIRGDIVVIHAEWPVMRAERRVRSGDDSFVVVVDGALGGPPGYYVLGRPLVVAALAASQDGTVRDALRLDREVTAPTVEWGARVRDASVHRVLVGPQGLLGVIAATARRRTRGGAESYTRKGAPEVLPSVSLEGAVEVARCLQGEMQESIALGETVSLLVSLHPAPGEGRSEATVTPVGTRLDILVLPKTGLSVVGPDEGVLEVTEPQADRPFRFHLKANEIGTTGVRIYALRGGATVASLVLPTEVLAGAATVGTALVPETTRIALVPRREPDLSLSIYEHETALTFRLRSADKTIFERKAGPTVLRTNPREHFRMFFRDIEQLPMASDDDRRRAEHKLQAKGVHLFETVFPRDVQELLRTRRKDIQTMQISSDEPWIPWEVCRFSEKAGAPSDPGAFFAEAFSVTRWLHDAPLAPRFRLRNVALVVPGDSKLQHAQAEKEFMKSLFGTKVTEIAPDYMSVVSAMSTSQYDLWHFTGHGRADAGNDADHAAIELANRELFTTEDAAGLENIFIPRPVVFLNACQTGQAGFSLTSIGGWAQRFLRPGLSGGSASAFIGTYWSVFDDGALKFAEAFYPQLLAGKTIGDAAKAARATIRKLGDPTWLAYTVYADPNATLESIEPAAAE